MISFGPILQLQLQGSLCPCMQKSEDANARLAVTAINKGCKRVKWIRDNSNSESSSSGFLGSIFAKASAVTGSGKKNDCFAKISIRDSSADGQPELFIDPLPDGSVQDETEGPLKQQSTGFKLNLKLRRVDKVSFDESSGQIALFAKAIIRDGKRLPPKELLRFVVLLADSNTPISQDQRNELVHNFMVVSEWERQRRAALSSEDAYESDEDEDEPNFIARQAQKVIARQAREVEMQQTKRDRENRKMKLIKESGGLKYTAMAMASRES